MTVYILEGFLLLSIPILFYFYTMRMSSNRNPDRAEIRAMRSGLKPGFDEMDKIIIENGVILTVSKLRRCGLSEWKVYISLDNAGADELYIEEIEVSPVISPDRPRPLHRNFTYFSKRPMSVSFPARYKRSGCVVLMCRSASGCQQDSTITSRPSRPSEDRFRRFRPTVQKIFGTPTTRRSMS